MNNISTRGRWLGLTALWVVLLGLVTLPLQLPAWRAKYFGFLLAHGDALEGLLLGVAILSVLLLVVHFTRPAWRPVTRCMLLSLALHTLLLLSSGLYRIEEPTMEKMAAVHSVQAEFGRESFVEGVVGESVREATLNLRVADTQRLSGPRAADPLPTLRAPPKPDAAPMAPAPPPRAGPLDVAAAKSAAPKASVEEQLEAHPAPVADVTTPAIAKPAASVAVNADSTPKPEPAARAIESAKVAAGPRAAADVAAAQAPAQEAESAPARLAVGQIPAVSPERKLQLEENLAATAVPAVLDRVTSTVATLQPDAPSPAETPSPRPAGVTLAKTGGQAATPESARPAANVTLQVEPARPEMLTAGPQPVEGAARIALVPSVAKAMPMNPVGPDRVGSSAAELIEVAPAEASAPTRTGPGAHVTEAKRAGQAGAVAGDDPARPTPELVNERGEAARSSMAEAQAQPVSFAEQGGRGAESDLAPASAAVGGEGPLRGVGLQMAAVTTAAPGAAAEASGGARGHERVVTAVRQGHGAPGEAELAPPRPDLGGPSAGAIAPGTLVADSGQPVSEGATPASRGITEGVTTVAVPGGGRGVDAIVAGMAPTVAVPADGADAGTGASKGVAMGIAQLAPGRASGAARIETGVVGGLPSAPERGGSAQPVMATLSGAEAGPVGTDGSAGADGVPAPGEGISAVGGYAAAGAGFDDMPPIAFNPGVDARGEPVYAAGDTGDGSAVGARSASMQVAKVVGAVADNGGVGADRAVRPASLAGGNGAAALQPLRMIGAGGEGVSDGSRVTMSEGLGTIDRRQQYRSADAAELQATPGMPRQKLIYSLRSPEKRRELIRELGGSAETEGAVEKALVWLARAQSGDGHWDVDAFQGVEECGGAGDRTDGDVGVTGLALLAYLGAGYTHNRGDHQETIQKALDWLVAGQAENGDLRRGGQLYVQAMAAAALCEVYSLSNDEHWLAPAQRAIRFILDAQNPEAGWRYQPRDDSDTSVTGWQVLALKSAEIAGIAVPPQHFGWTAQWLDKVRRGREGGLYAYKEGHGPTAVMTAEGWFCQLFMGREQRGRGEAESARYLMANLPEWNPTQRGVIHFYYWYYATLALHLSGGQDFDVWNVALRETLLKGQRQGGAADGSWDPVDQLGERGGRMYSTTMATLCLEIYYRYLPFYQIGER